MLGLSSPLNSHLPTPSTMLPSFLCPYHRQVGQDISQEIDASSSSYYLTKSDLERNDDLDTDSTLEKMQWQSWQDDVRNALLFASLLSVVVTPFIMESNRKLSPNSQDAVVDLLTRIATLASQGETDTSPSALNSIFIPSSTTPVAFTPNPAYIRANTLWLISLVLSLTTILFGSLLSQWLRACRSYTLPSFTFTSSSSSSSSGSSFPSHSLFSPSCGQTPLLSPLFKSSFAFNTLGKRHIRMALSTLPLFLQLAVVLFLGGLMDYVQVFGDCGVWVSVGVLFVFVGFIFRTVVMH